MTGPACGGMAQAVAAPGTHPAPRVARGGCGVEMPPGGV